PTDIRTIMTMTMDTPLTAATAPPAIRTVPTTIRTTATDRPVSNPSSYRGGICASARRSALANGGFGDFLPHLLQRFFRLPLDGDEIVARTLGGADQFIKQRAGRLSAKHRVRFAGS